MTTIRAVKLIWELLCADPDVRIVTNIEREVIASYGTFYVTSASVPLVLERITFKPL